MAEYKNDDIKILTRPCVSTSTAKEIFIELYDCFEIVDIHELNSYEDRNFYISYTNRESHFTILECVLKIIDTNKDGYVQFLQSLIELLSRLENEKLHFQTSVPLKMLDGSILRQVYLKDDKFNLHERLPCAAQYHLLTLSFIPGHIYLEIYQTITKIHLSNLGKNLGQLSKTLINVMHGLDFNTFKANSSWIPLNMEMNREIILKIENFVDKSEFVLLQKYYKLFMNNIITNVDSFQPGLIHSDLNESNLILNDNGSLVGVIDWLDCVVSHPIFDIASSMAYLMQLRINRIIDGGVLLQGYLSEFHLNESEKEVLFYAICGRLIVSISLGLYFYSLDPTNKYLLLTPKPCLSLLKYLDQFGKEEADRIWYETDCLNSELNI